MKAIMIFLFALLASTAVAEVNHYYKINLLYDQGNVTYRSLAVEPVNLHPQMVEGTYVAEVLSFDNRILNLTFFHIPLFFFYEKMAATTGELTEGSETEDQAQIVLYVPYYSNAKEINIYDEELIKKLRINVSSYAKEQAALGEAAPVRKDEIKTELRVEIPNSTKAAKIGIGLGIAVLLLIIILSLLYWWRKK